MLKTIGVIGVRSQSKSIKDKNIKDLFGHPLVAWIIQTAKSAKHLDRVIVSTDSEEYAHICKRYGAEVPFIRPANISTDHSLEMEYLQHTVEWLRDHEGYRPDIVTRLQATCPLQLPEDVDQCVECLLHDPSADSAMVVAEAHQHPDKAIRLIEQDGKKYGVSLKSGTSKDLTPFNRQKSDKVYFRANIIATRTDVLMKGSQSGEKTRLHVIPQERALDINTEYDFMIAEALIRKFRSPLSL